MGRACALATLIGLLIFAGTAHAADRIYWTTRSDVVGWANLDGSGGGSLPIGRTTASGSGIAIDPTTSRLYFTDFHANEILYVNLDGSGGGPLNTAGATVNGPAGLSLDSVTRRLYWSNLNVAKISYGDLDGSGGHDLAVGSAPIDEPADLALDPSGGRIFWTNQNPSTALSYARLNGAGGGHVPTTRGGNSGVAIDTSQRRAYLTGFGSNEIWTARLNGQGGELLAISGATVDHPAGIAIDPTSRRIYWANFGGGAPIASAKLDGSGAADLPASGAVFVNPSFVALLKAPAADDPLVVKGGLNPGSLLSCSPATWLPDLPASHLYRSPQTVTHQWTRDGDAIPGATATSYTASQGGQYRCMATASNAAGVTTETSAAHTVLSVPDYTDPVIKSLKVKPQTFKATKGATVTYTVSEFATTKFTVEARHGKHYLALRGGLSRTTAGGPIRFHFNARLKGRRLSPGSYRLTASAEDPTGNQSAVAKRSFKIRG
jgi:DNA-binding beta-propeller fold protein YncE